MALREKRAGTQNSTHGDESDQKRMSSILLVPSSLHSQAQMAQEDGRLFSTACGEAMFTTENTKWASIISSFPVPTQRPKQA